LQYFKMHIPIGPQYSYRNPMADDLDFIVGGVDDDELSRIRQQIGELEESHHLRTAQDAAAKEEGQRKSAGPTSSSSASAGSAKNTSVFVGGMDPKTTESELRIFFNSCGPIKRVTILKDKFSGQSKGTAYVEFEGEQACSSALLRDGQQCHGKPLKVAVKRDNVPQFMRGGTVAPGSQAFQAPMFRGRGRGTSQAPNPMAAMGMMMATMMGSALGFNPMAQGTRGRGRGGSGRGRGQF
jgi:hypothetical protein